MYENYTRQSLPTRRYRELLGSALCVFSSNNSFIIENIMHTDSSYDWYTLIDKESGYLKEDVADTISVKTGSTQIKELFSELIKTRNRIIHGFQITTDNGEQILATKTRREDGNIQFQITEEYLMKFIDKNQKLSDLLYAYRSY